MLGFSAFSQSALGEATTVLAALGYFSTTVANTNAGTLAYQALAHVTPSSATASGIANAFGDVDAQATTSVVSVFSSFNISDLVDIDAQATVTPSPAVANFTNAGVDFTAFAHITTSNVGASTAIEELADVDAKANTTLSSTSAYLTIYITDFADEDAQARAFMSPAVSQTNVNLDDPVAVRFPYQDYADSYERSRVLYIVGYDDNRTVHISPENNTVYIDKDTQSYTVYIAA